MCRTDNREALRNGHAADLATQGHALADVLDSLAGIETQLRAIPTRDEVRDMITTSLRVHIETCDHARDDHSKPEPTKFHLGKGGLEMEGRAAMLAGVALGGVTVLFLLKAIPYVKEWLVAWFSRGG